MIMIDKVLVRGLGFVLDSIARSVDGQMNDVQVLRDMLMNAQLQFEAGGIERAELEAVETELLGRIGELSQKEPVGLDVRNVRVVAPELGNWGEGDGSALAHGRAAANTTGTMKMAGAGEGVRRKGLGTGIAERRRPGLVRLRGARCSKKKVGGVM